jgi:hypothetical protein
MKKFITILIAIHCLLLTANLSQAQQATNPKVKKNVWFFKTEPIRDMTVVLPGVNMEEQEAIRNRFPRRSEELGPGSGQPDKPDLQTTPGSVRTRGPLLNFEGIGNVQGVYPADPNGEVGLNHYIQTVNCSFAVWDKSGDLLFGPVHYKTIWASFPGPWNNYNWSDPVIKYDHMADRWVIVSMSFNYTFYYTMVAVSETPDPMGAYYCYAYYYGNDMNDYPKLSIWPDGYYLTYNFWDSQDETFMYSLAGAADREAMLNGEATATMIEIEVPNSDEGDFFPLPADCRGAEVPDSEPCYIATLGSHDPGNFWQFSLDIYAFNTDWEVPSNSTLECIYQFDIGEFEPITAFEGAAPQMGSEFTVNTIPIYLMYPLTYRALPGYEAMTLCHTAWDGEINYIKWYELRKDSEDWYIYQTGNYAPGDEHYFMGSISINGNGDIALGYSISSEDMYPSIHLTGRRAEDEPGEMTLEPLELYQGLNYANNYQSEFEQNRWGDYSSMMVDPEDDTTFWYTNMYTLATTGIGNWATRIFSFNMSEDTAWPYAFAGNDTIAPGVLFFETQGEAENYSSIIWTTSGDGNFINNYAEQVTYLRGPADLDSGQVTLSMHITGYYPGSMASDSMVLYLLAVGMDEPSVDDMSFTVYPNPTSDIITVKADLQSDNQLKLNIISESGNQIFTGCFAADKGHFEQQFDLSYLPDGVYFVKAMAGQKSAGLKLIKM